MYTPNHEGEKLRIYGLNLAHWEAMTAVLQRRQEKRNSFVGGADSSGSSPISKESYNRGDLGTAQGEVSFPVLSESPKLQNTAADLSKALEMERKDLTPLPLPFPPLLQRTS
jgi:hypothetical protein